MAPAIAVLGWSIADVTFHTLATYTLHAPNVTSSYFDYDVKSTTLDMTILSGVRACIAVAWLTSSLGCLRGMEGKKTVLYYSSLFLLLIMWIYNGVKLLLFAEDTDIFSDWNRRLQLGWTSCACLIHFALLSWSNRAHVTSVFKKRFAGSDAAEHMPLLEGSAPKDKESVEGRGEGLSAFSQLVKHSRIDLPIIVFGLFFLLGSVACEIMVPMYIGAIIDSLVNIADISQPDFRTAIHRLSFVTVTMSLCSWMRMWMFNTYVARLTARLRRRFFDSVMSQDLDFFAENETGNLVSRLISDIAMIGHSLCPNFDHCLKAFFCGAAATVLMFRISWQLSVLSVLCLPAFVAVSCMYGTTMKSIGKSTQWKIARMAEHAEETFANVRTVRSFAMETKEGQRFHGLVLSLYCNGKKSALVHSTFQTLNLLIQNSLQVCALLYGGHLVGRHVLSSGDLVTFVIFLSMINTCVQVINSVFGMLLTGIGASHVVFEHLGRQPRHTATGSHFAKSFRGEIEFKDVSFRYPSRPHQYVLKNVSFRVRAGEVVALVGGSGGGKSTCVYLLQNFYLPDSGHVLLDGVPVTRYDHRCLHSKMALVGQEPALFSRSFRHNITYGLDACADADVISAAKKANAHDFICAMSQGYDTDAGEKGLQISGGQKQRLAIARALVRQPAVLLLDEATSALDSESEAKVMDALWERSRGSRTVLIIAHRLSTVEKADRVLVIHNGQLVEEGTPSDLLNSGGVFASLAQHQLQRSGSSSLIHVH